MSTDDWRKYVECISLFFYRLHVCLSFFSPQIQPKGKYLWYALYKYGILLLSLRQGSKTLKINWRVHTHSSLITRQGTANVYSVKPVYEGPLRETEWVATARQVAFSRQIQQDTFLSLERQNAWPLSTGGIYREVSR